MCPYTLSCNNHLHRPTHLGKVLLSNALVDLLWQVEQELQLPQGTMDTQKTTEVATAFLGVRVRKGKRENLLREWFGVN